MRKSQSKEINLNYVRLLSIDDLMRYTSLGHSKALELGTAAGARLYFGRRVMYDKRKVDAYIDTMETDREAV